MKDYSIETSRVENGSYRALATRLMASANGSLDYRLPLAEHHTTSPENRGVFTTLRSRLIRRAGRPIRPQGQLTLSVSVNPAVRDELLHYLEALKAA